MTFQFLEQCGIPGVFSVFLASLFVFASMILTYSFSQIGLKKYLLIHGAFIGITLLASVGLHQTVQNPEAVMTCAKAPVKMLMWIPVVIAFTMAIHFFFKSKRARAFIYGKK